MKNALLLITFHFLIIGLFTNSPNKQSRGVAIEDNSIACAPVFEDIDPMADGKFMVVLPGWGNHQYTISTTNDSAQFYFNQGLNMYYSYHAREANASFKEAARFDPDCAMVYWGQALAMGPAYNFAHGYIMRKEVPGVIGKMNTRNANASEKEKDLIEAMNARYSPDSSDKERKNLNAAYSKKMQALVSKYPDDEDITALYIDAVMLEHPWNFWNNDGSPKEWTPELVGLCEGILKKDRQHPGALHYYIHVTEASRKPERALASADVLKDLLPGVAHMVHMSSHVYERNGSYAKGVEVNEKADQDLVYYDSLVKHLNTVSLSRHVPHYFAVQSYCALSGAMYSKGMPLAFRTRKSVSPSYQNTYQQYLYMIPVMAWVRMGKWNEILDDKDEAAQDWTYARLLYHFAKGMAYVNTDDIASAKMHLQRMTEKSKDSILNIIDTPFNCPAQGVFIAENILNGSILFSEKKFNAAIDCFKKAIHMEDSLIYVEPKDWMIPARQYLGAYLMKLKRHPEAEKIYREDLVFNPGNGWSLLGLYQTLKAQGKYGEAAIHRTGYLKSFSAADQIPTGSVYLK
ncbi:MAG: tetratricopeptide repeat protein [Chitinophagaceae bacterium]|nr:tetratricopeptide repeat protein [Chitinophagaceae bacterium]